ncbi:hypothetical protein LIER_25723 [Lithospermum erythrorhizon]|uniref:Uncharacterized protein n=1 Tax=Lithospermum erythrorhizon TaxID=34254 RepID=A0AAV3R919_LITER
MGKAPQPPTFALTPMVSPSLFVMWGIDLVGKLPKAKRGAEFAIVAVDYFFFEESTKLRRDQPPEELKLSYNTKAHRSTAIPLRIFSNLDPLWDSEDSSSQEAEDSEEELELDDEVGVSDEELERDEFIETAYGLGPLAQFESGPDPLKPTKA